MIGVLGFDLWWGLGIFLFTTASRMALGPTQPPIQWAPGALSLWVKRPGSEADHSFPSSAEVKEWVELYLHSPNTPSWCGAQLKHMGDFTFTFSLSHIVMYSVFLYNFQFTNFFCEHIFEAPSDLSYKLSTSFFMEQESKTTTCSLIFACTYFKVLWLILEIIFCNFWFIRLQSIACCCMYCVSYLDSLWKCV
jgi:hypothetical protein